MRTTVTLEPDLSTALKARMKQTKAPFKKIINEVLRRGLGLQKRRRRFRVRAFAMGLRTGIDPTKLNQLYDELETADAVSKR